MRLADFFRKKREIKRSSHFSDFFLHASIDKKKEVFTEAARLANEAQREVFKELDLKLKTN